MADEKKVFFMSDTHIRGAHDASEDMVYGFLRDVVQPEGSAADLYMLGDMIEFWFEYPGLVLNSSFRFLASVRACVEAGVRVFWLPGNRDFTIGRFIRQEVGVQVCGEVEEITLGGRRVMLTHGDLLCTWDTSYQRWRNFIRNPIVRGGGRLIPPLLRGMICRLLVKASKYEVRRKELDLQANVLETATERVRAGVDVVICGHVHRALHRPILVEGRAGDLYTLGLWDGAYGTYLVWDGQDFQLKRFPAGGGDLRP